MVSHVPPSCPPLFFDAWAPLPMLTHRRVLLTHTTGSLLVDFAVILPECLPDGSTNPRLPSSQARFQPTTSPWTGHLEYPILRRSRPAPSKFQPTFPIPIPVSRPLAVVGAERITFGFSSASDNAEMSHTRIMVNNSPVPPAVTHVTIHHETSLIIRTAVSELNLTSIPVRTNRAEQSTNMLNKTTVPMTNKINFKVSSSTLRQAPKEICIEQTCLQPAWRTTLHIQPFTKQSPLSDWSKLHILYSTKWRHGYLSINASPSRSKSRHL